MTTVDGEVLETSLRLLASDRRVEFLFALVWELALAGRGSYVEAGSSVAESQRALRCLNELRIVVDKQLATAVRGTEPAYPDTAFLTVLDEKAGPGGCQPDLGFALVRAATSTDSSGGPPGLGAAGPSDAPSR